MKDGRPILCFGTRITQWHVKYVLIKSNKLILNFLNNCVRLILSITITNCSTVQIFVHQALERQKPRFFSNTHLSIVSSGLLLGCSTQFEHAFPRRITPILLVSEKNNNRIP